MQILRNENPKKKKSRCIRRFQTFTSYLSFFSLAALWLLSSGLRELLPSISQLLPQVRAVVLLFRLAHLCSFFRGIHPSSVFRRISTAVCFRCLMTDAHLLFAELAGRNKTGHSVRATASAAALFHLFEGKLYQHNERRTAQVVRVEGGAKKKKKAEQKTHFKGSERQVAVNLKRFSGSSIRRGCRMKQRRYLRASALRSKLAPCRRREQLFCFCKQLLDLCCRY